MRRLAHGRGRTSYTDVILPAFAFLKNLSIFLIPAWGPTCDVIEQFGM